MPRDFPGDDAEPQFGLPPPFLRELGGDALGFGALPLGLPVIPTCGDSPPDASFVELDKVAQFPRLTRGTVVQIAVSGHAQLDWDQTAITEEYDTFNVFGDIGCVYHDEQVRSEVVNSGADFELLLALKSTIVDVHANPDLTIPLKCRSLFCGSATTADFELAGFSDESGGFTANVNIDIANTNSVTTCLGSCSAHNPADSNVDCPGKIKFDETPVLQARFCRVGNISYISLKTEVQISLQPDSPFCGVSFLPITRLYIYSGDWIPPDGGTYSGEIDAGTLFGIAMHARYGISGWEQNIASHSETGTHPTCSHADSYFKFDRDGTVGLAVSAVEITDTDP